MIYIVAEHNGIVLKNYLVERCLDSGLVIEDLYDIEDDQDDYPVVAKILANKMKIDTNSFGVAICSSGQGINIAMNRFPWVRAALPVNINQSKKTREHNNANCLSFGAQEIDKEVAFEILQAFVNTPFSTQERHLRRVQKLG
jgi:ribose 5-phosphate isomerase B